MKVKISVQEADFDIGIEIGLVRDSTRNLGALVTFTGLVRELHPVEQAGTGGHGSSVQAVHELFLEHYPGMTEKALTDIAHEAGSRWSLLGATIIHRIGVLRPGDQIVLVITASEHRGDAFAAAEFMMDYLKTRAPFWKRQSAASSQEWLGPRDSDELRAARWQEVKPTD